MLIILPLENYLTSAVALMPKKSKSDEEKLKAFSAAYKTNSYVEANKAEDNLLGT